MALQRSKEEAIVQLFNCVSPKDLTKIKQLSDGKFLQDTITEFSESKNKYINNVREDKMDYSDVECANISLIKCENENSKNGSCVQSSVVKLTKSLDDPCAQDSGIKSESPDDSCVQNSAVESVESLYRDLYVQNCVKQATLDEDSSVQNTAIKPAESFDGDLHVESTLSKSLENSCVQNFNIKPAETLIDGSCIQNSVKSDPLDEDLSLKNSVATSTENFNDDDKVWQRFISIKNFINDAYGLKSDDMISYSECMKSNDLELAKVASFVLSEVVKHWAEIRDDRLQTLSLLEPKVQENLEECFRLFIIEREKISKSEVERILCSRVRSRVLSSSRSYSETPPRRCQSAYKRRTCTETPSNEDVFTNSPLKSFFESPVFKKEDIIKREKELAKTWEHLIEEELKSEEMEVLLKDYKKELKVKESVICKLKEEKNELERTIEDLKRQIADFEEALAKQAADYNILHSEYMKEQDVIQYLEVQNKKLLVEKIVPVSGEISNRAMRRRETEAYDKGTEFAKTLYKKQLTEKDEEILNLKKAVDELREKSEELRRVNGELEHELINREKEAGKSDTDKDQSEYPVFGENIGSVIEEEYRRLQEKYNRTKLKIVELEKDLKRKDITNEQNHTYSSENSLDISTSKFLENSEVKGTLWNSNKHSENGIEHDDDECIVPNNSDVKVKKSNARIVSSLPGVLWKKYESPYQCENTHTSNFIEVNNDLNIQENTDKMECRGISNDLNVPQNIVTYEMEFFVLCNLLQNPRKLLEHLEACKSQKYFTTNGSNGCDIPVLINALTARTAPVPTPQDKRCSNCNTVLPGNENKRMESDDLMCQKKVNNDLVGKETENSFKKESELSKRESELSKRESELAKRESKLVKRKNELAKKEKELELVKEVNELKKEKKKELAEKEELKEKDNKLKEKENKLKEKEEKINQLNSKIAELDTKCKEILDGCKESEDLIKKEYESKLQEASKKSYKWEKKCTELKDKCRNSRMLYEELERRAKFMSERINQLQKENTSSCMKNRLLMDKEIRDAVKVKEITLKFKNSYALKLKNLEKDVERLKSEKLKVEREFALFVAKVNEKNSNNYETSVSWKNREAGEEGFNHNSEFALLECPSTSICDMHNESVLSGALRIRGSFINDDEADFVNQSSLAEIKRGKNDRCNELHHRNSMLPFHLQSSYPAEADLPVSSESLYVRSADNFSCPGPSHGDGGKHEIKKRKLEDMQSETESVRRLRTPYANMKRTLKTPRSLMKLLPRRQTERHHRKQPKS